MRLAQGMELYANSLKWLVMFIIAAPMKKHIQQFILPKVVSCQFVDRKLLWVYCHDEAKYFLCWIYQPGFYFISLHKIIMSEQP